MTRNKNGPVVLSRKADQVVEIARLLGHADVDVYPTPSGAKWRVDCACGWEGTGMVRQVEAIAKGRAHLVNAVTNLDRYARSHGLTPGQALSEFALSDAELRDLDLRVAERIEFRESLSPDV